MENKFGLTDLSDHELKEFNGGVMLIISLFLGSVRKALDLYEGLVEGYNRGVKQ